MDCAKTGGLIATLRKEKGMTQKNLADALGISNKTVSKWECGMGSPDLTFWPDLSAILGADITQMMEGEITVNKPDIGNLYKLRIYVCPDCGNILVSTGGAAVYCCGKKTEALSVCGEAEQPQVTVENSDIDFYLTVDHPMRKDHYISAAIYVNNDRVLITRLYPEQSAGFRIPVCRGGRLYLYCVKHGLSSYSELF